MQVNFNENTPKAELIIREVARVNELDVKAPLKLSLTGVIGSAYAFLSKRVSEKDQINPVRCHILINREDLTIKLVFNENDEYTTGSVSGRLELHPKFKEFGINLNKEWEPAILGQFFKMNRVFFASREDNMKLVSDLKNFTAKVDSVIEKTKSEVGSWKDNYSGVVTSNLPEKFNLKIPIFRGRPAEDLEVEFYASIDGRDVSLQLCSPGAVQALEDLRDSVINEQIDLIKGIAPGIAIIEQ